MPRTEHEKATAKQPKSRIPRFKTIEEEAEFWDTHSTTEFEDEFEEVQDVRFVVSRGRPKKAITVRVDEETLAILADQAHAQGIGPSTLIRIWILERLHKGPKRHGPTSTT